MPYLADADSDLPNLALMRLAAHFRSKGQSVLRITPDTPRDLWNHRIGDTVYGSSIFNTRKSARKRAEIEREWGDVLWGGTGVDLASNLRQVADIDWDVVAPDYSIYPDFAASIGFLTRGCRLKCGFCVVPTKEGKPRQVSTIEAIWRGAGHPRHLHLLDNDAFSPYAVDGVERRDMRQFWRDVTRELIDGKFKVCFSQGLNVRLIDDEGAALLSSLHYVGNDFDKRIVYTAWDNLRDEGIFRQGVEHLRRAGIEPHRLRVFMLCGYRKGETWEDLFYRFAEILALGAEPFVMLFGDDGERPALEAFQRWSNKWMFRSIAWPDYARDGTFDTRINRDERAASDAAWHRVVGRLLADTRGVET